MKHKKGKKRVIYPIALPVELYALITQVSSLYLASTRANVMRTALQIGLDAMMEKHEQA